jgi:hypothetical protein
VNVPVRYSFAVPLTADVGGVVFVVVGVVVVGDLVVVAMAAPANSPSDTIEAARAAVQEARWRRMGRK